MATKHTGIIRNPDGTATIIKKVKGAWIDRDGGRYFIAENRRIYVDNTIPRGYVTVWDYGNPEPVGHEPCKGMTAFDVEFITGPLLPRWLGAAFEGRAIDLRQWMRYGLVGLVFAGLLGATIYLLRNGGIF